MKRKRGGNTSGDRTSKIRKNASNQSALAKTPGEDHPVLRPLYPEVLSLRHYLLSRLPTSSKNRRRKFSQLGISIDENSPSYEFDLELGRLLDSTLVGVSPRLLGTGEDDDSMRCQDIEAFSQGLDAASASTFRPGYFLQAEVVDFVIWLLFKRHSGPYKPSHLLCHGFQREWPKGHNEPIRSGPIPGIMSCAPNPYVRTLKSPLWCRLHSLLGKGGDRIIMDMLLYCGIFNCIDSQSGNYYQLSGCPLSEVKPLLDTKHDKIGVGANDSKGKNGHTPVMEPRKPSAITFVRSRMFYARAALNAKGGVRFGMRHIHVLNRFPDREDYSQTVHIMKYIFPRQFDLHNVFTSKVDSRESAMPFKDYTLREKEIQQMIARQTFKKGLSAGQMENCKSHIPKRLRGETVTLVEKLRKLNHRCSYIELLRHYCPMEGLNLSTKPDSRKIPQQLGRSDGSSKSSNSPKRARGSQKKSEQTVEQTSFTDMATPVAHVSAFCRAVVAKVIPNAFWGDDNNKRTVMYWIDHFICMRKFENLTLHQVTQKLQITALAWLRPPGHPPTAKMARSDFDKRQEIFLEFVYWVFDSFLIPLVRSNFHVTESNVHRNRVFYFRHDVWLMLTEPSLTNLKADMFEEMPSDRVSKLLTSRPLGYSKIRLVPKTTGVRMITNLRRRQQFMRNGVMMLGRSINSVMAPTYNIINYERSLHPDKFGCSLFSTGDMFPKLISFRESLKARGLRDVKLYFAKVDVKSCFDTIPQQRLLTMVEDLLSIDEYQTGRHVEMRPLGRLQQLDGPRVNPLPIKRYLQHSKAAKEATSFEKLVGDHLAKGKSNTVFVDTAVQQFETKENLLRLLREHVERNLVQFGKKFYRQKTGIPQGSVLSSILCNFFYAELEREELFFLRDEDSLLMRLLDDFLLITIHRRYAERFVQTMHSGNPKYGVTVKAQKSLANFDVETGNGQGLAKPVSETQFPYCGVLIDTRTLEVSKNSDRSGRGTIADSLTVDLTKMPGQTFQRKALNGFKIQLQTMFIDTSLNSVTTVLANLYQSFLDCAQRCFEYGRVLAKARTTHTHPRLLIKMVERVIALACVMLQRRTRNKGSQNAERVRCAVSRRHVQWVACKAFTAIFTRKQTQHRELLEWLAGSLAAASPRTSAERCMLEGAVAGQATAQ